MKIVWTVIELVFLIYVCSGNDNCTFVCPKNSGNFADPCTCRRFYKCADFVAHRNFCPTGLFWDDIRKFCTYKNEAVCGPIVEVKKDEGPVDVIPKCNKSACSLPFCFCSEDGTEAPIENPPQFILLMLDGAVNLNNFQHYKKLFNKTHRGSDCKLKGTFFIHHEYSNYEMIEELYVSGHEMAIISTTSEPLQFSNASAWRAELLTMREILGKFANIPTNDIIGVRAPHLKPGFNHQYDVLVDEGFIWDSSISTLPLAKPVWPYTLDYAIPHKCRINSCPSKSYPGVWEIPLNLHYVKELGGGECPYLDQCVFAQQTKEDIFQWLKQDFMRHYTSDKAPYTMPFHTNWFTNEEQVKALHEFIDWSLSLNDTYYITVTELLIWLSERTVNHAETLVGDCANLNRTKSCKQGTVCELQHIEKDGSHTVRYMATCNPCPPRYPWLHN